MAKKQHNPDLLSCRNCEFCHSPYNLSFDGKNIMGKCKKYEFSVLLKQKQCGEFKNSRKVIL